MKKLKLILFEISRITIALVFLFSSIVKANDPVGVSLKIKEYFVGLPSTIVGILDYLSMPIALVLIFIEFILGLRLLLGRKPVRTTVLTFLFMFIMTIITTIMYFTDTVKDCGCFGDAIHLTNGETLLKNIIILPITIFLMWNASLIRPIWAKGMMRLNKYLAIVGFIVFLFFNYYWLPYIDFRGYSNGTDLRDKIEQQDIKQNRYLTENTKYIYSKDGKEQAFHIDSLPSDDKAWRFVRVDEPQTNSNSLLEYDFHPIDINDKIDISKEILSSREPVIVVLTRSLGDINSNDDKILHNLSIAARKKGYPQYFLFVNKDENKDGNFASLYANDLGNIATLDNTTLYTITRQFPSIMVIRNGKIIQKLSSWDFPKLSNITNFVEELASMPIKSKSYIRIIVLVLSIILAIVGNVKMGFKRKRNN